jgi:hypothetical protein
MMNREELEGVIGHEMSHIKNYDVRLLLIVSTLIDGAGLLASLVWRSAFFMRPRGQDSDWFHRLLDTHPPISERIAVLERIAQGQSVSRRTSSVTRGATRIPIADVRSRHLSARSRPCSRPALSIPAARHIRVGCSAGRAGPERSHPHDHPIGGVAGEPLRGMMAALETASQSR